MEQLCTLYPALFVAMGARPVREGRMTLDMTVKATDLAIVFATLLGPILAVQAQKWLERRRERNARRLALFRTLMATRAARLAPDHVRALNGIPLEFYGTKKRLKRIRDAWKVYFAHLSSQHAPENAQSWQQKSDDLFLDLLRELADFLGYDEFNPVELGKEVYSPQAHLALEADNLAIRQGLAALLKGQFALPIEQRIGPLDPAAQKLLADLGGKKR